MKIIRVGVDLAKNVVQVHGVDRRGKVIWRRQLKRSKWVEVLSERVEPGCEVGMEACGGAHHWARELRARGYVVKVMAAQHVKPYVKSNKSDRNDAAAICEAMSRPDMRYVTVKSVEQQEVQAVHRVRSALMSQRKAKSSQIRGLVSEYGLVAPRSLGSLRQAIPQWLEDAENGLSGGFRRLLSGLWEDLGELDRRVGELDGQLRELARGEERTRRLMKLRGVGPVVATGLMATLGTGEQFRRGRDFAVSLGLTPAHYGTGGRVRLGGISKRGDAYMRTQLIHGARSVLRHMKHRDDSLSRWLQGLVARKHPNVVAVALAAKTARIAWSMVRHGSEYQAHPPGLEGGASA